MQQHHGNDHDNKKSTAKRGPHRDWRFWVAIAMLIGMAIYVFTLDEAIRPGGEEVPAAIETDAAP